MSMLRQAQLMQQQELEDAYDRHAKLQDGESDDEDDDDDQDEDEEEEETFEDEEVLDDEMDKLVENVLADQPTSQKLKRKSDLQPGLFFPAFLLKQHKHFTFIVELEHLFADLLEDNDRDTRELKNVDIVSRKIAHTYAELYNFSTMSKQIGRNAGKNQGRKSMQITKTSASKQPQLLLSEALAHDEQKLSKAQQEETSIAIEETILENIENITDFIRKTPQRDFAQVNLAAIMAAVRRLKKRIKKVQTRVHLMQGEKARQQQREFMEQGAKYKDKMRKEKQKAPVQFVVGGKIEAQALDNIEITGATTTSAAASSQQAPAENKQLSATREATNSDQQVAATTTSNVDAIVNNNQQAPQGKAQKKVASSEDDDDDDSDDSENDEDGEDNSSDEGEIDTRNKSSGGKGAPNADRGFAKFLDGNVGNNVMKMMTKMGYNFENPHGLGKGGSGIVNPVKLEQKTKKIYNLVSDFTTQQQAEAAAVANTASAATSGETPNEEEKPVYKMNSLYDLSVTNNRRNKKSAKHKAIEDGINAQQQQQAAKGNKKNKNGNKNKAHQKQKRQQQKKMNDFITKELSKLNL